MKPIVIIGGGLAGLSLGLALRERDVRVTIYEAGDYPRHRVCGEFISGNGQRWLHRLNLRAQPAATAAFFADGHCHRFSLPEPALCVSRYELDKALADQFLAVGGTLVCRTRSNATGEGVVHATGRRLHPIENGWRWFGLKAHATDIELEADLEMHLVRNGYIGICRLTERRVNACGLFRKRRGDTTRITLADSLDQRFKNAHWVEGTSVAVSGLCFCPAPNDAACRIGDANSMIAPMTGNGMSLAFESAAAAVEPLVRYAEGGAPWAESVQQINLALDRFRKRLAWGKWLQWAAFHPRLLALGTRAGLHKLLFAATR